MTRRVREVPLAAAVGVWDRLGFRENPYYLTHLPVTSVAGELFTGRDADRRRLRDSLLTNPAGRTLVQGPPGVGKTSLVNVVQQDLWAAAGDAAGRRAPTVEVVETSAGMSREAFLLTVLSAAVASARQLFAADAALDREPAFRAAAAMVTQTLEREAVMTATAGVMGIGGSLGESLVTFTPLGITTPALLERLRPLVALLCDRAAAAGLVVPVNNLDALAYEDARDVLTALRDVVSTAQRIHWIFIAGAGFAERLESDPRGRRLSESFTGSPVNLLPLGWPDVEEALERRRRVFAARPREAPPPLPLSAAVTQRIYDAGGAELRFTFKRCSDVAQDFLQQFPSETRVPDHAAFELLRAWGLRQLEASPPTRRERDAFDAVVREGGLRPRDFARAGFTTAQRFSQVLVALVEKRYLVVREAPGERLYVPSAAARLAAGPGLEERLVLGALRSGPTPPTSPAR